MDGGIEITIEPSVLTRISQAAARGQSLRLRLTVATADQDDFGQGPVAGPVRGPLAPLIAAGELRPQDRLVWHRPRRRAQHVAVVLPNGQLELDGVCYDSPSGAASAASGNSVDGWWAWRREADGVLLGELRRHVERHSGAAARPAGGDS